MASKYRGKYKKCRTCAHAEEVMMVLVVTNADCPHSRVYSSGSLITDKYTCERCDRWLQKAKQ